MSVAVDYQRFLETKRSAQADHGLELPERDLNPHLFPFQKAIVQWALRRGCAAIFADCGLGKSAMQLEWAHHISRHAEKPVLILAPLAVGPQTVAEAAKFGIEAARSDDGTLPSRITVTNYERLHYFDPLALAGVVCDESSILKAFDGKVRAQITEFMRQVPFRLLCTATAGAPNDYLELGTSSEAIGELGHVDMLSRFFTNDNRVSYRKANPTGSDFRLKGHAEQPFWRWVCSWARAARKPSDLGFDDAGFDLPPLTEHEHVIKARRPQAGRLFDVTAIGLAEEREVRRRTLPERCETAAQLAFDDWASNGAHRRPWVMWVHLNAEQEALEGLLGDQAFSVHGSLPLEEKESRLAAWLAGERPVLISKPTVCGFGINMQHCANVVYFPTDSYEQYYQAIRRCWRFGQKLPVSVHIIRTESQERMMANLHRKAAAADRMFNDLVANMAHAETMARPSTSRPPVEVPSWLSL